MYLVICAVIFGLVRSQGFFDKVMGYNAKAQQFIDDKKISDETIYPPRQSPLFSALLQQRNISADQYSYKSIVKTFVEFDEDYFKSLKQTQLMDAQFAADEQETEIYSRRMADLKWKDERVRKNYEYFMQEADVIQQRLTDNNALLEQSKKTQEQSRKDYEKQLGDQKALLDSLLAFKGVILETLEAANEKAYYNTLAIVKDHIQNGSLISRRKNVMLPQLSAQVEKLSSRPNFKSDQRVITQVLSMILTYISETQIYHRELEMEATIRHYEANSQQTIEINSCSSAEQAHHEHMKMIKERHVTMGDEVQLVQRNLKDLEKEMKEFVDLNDNIWKLEDKSLYYLRDDKKNLQTLHNELY